ncbi:MAG: hypothetical protein KAH14_07570 [Clostridiales bacterium]|nr:hypothetical protein [Clostridiales bacterium]
MKKALSLLISFSLFFTVCVSCSGQSENSPANEISSFAPLPETVIINVYRPPVGNFVTFKGQEEWETYINENYGISVKIHNISPLHQSAIATSNYYPQAIKDGNISGLIELNISDFPNLGSLKSEGLILPLDEFLSDNLTFNALPESMKSAFKFADGQIWALPVSSPEGIAMRYLKSDWLEVLDYNIPQTLDELFEVSKAFAFNDPNGNGEHDEYGMNINRRTGARMLNDIFLANDCYLSNYTACSIAFDYTTSAYEDAALKPSFRDSLIYIKALNDAGILHISQDWSFRESDRFGNFYDFSNFNGSAFDTSEWTSVYSFKEDKEKSVIALKPQKCFVLTSNTDSPDSVINAFVNVFLSGINGMALGTFGLPDNNFSLDGNTINHFYESSDGQGSDFYEKNLWLTGLNHDMLNSSEMRIDSSYFSDQYLAISKTRIEEYNDLLNKNMLFSDSWFLPHPNYKSVQKTFGPFMYRYLLEMDSIDIDEYISNYIESAKKASADQILDDLNQDAGTFATYGY